MNDIAISVILPVYNEEAYIQEAIDSILNQTFIDLELIIIDDSSDDGTTEKILGCTDNRIIYKRNEHNLGNYPARNIGIQLAKGKYIAVMDADDISYPERLQKEYEFLEEHLDILAVGCDCTVNGQYLKRKQPVNFEEILTVLLRNNCFIHSSLLIRTDVIQKLKGYDTQYMYAADYDLICRIAILGKIENLPNKLMMYRCHDGQISQKYTDKQRMYAYQIRRKYQLNFIRKYATHEMQHADYYTLSLAKMGEIICLYVYSMHTGFSIYEEQADNLFNEILSQIIKLDFHKSEEIWCGFCCGMLYLSHNNMLKRNEGDILDEIEKQLNEFYSSSNNNEWVQHKLDGWIHYLRLRIQSDKRVENTRTRNTNLLNRLLSLL